MDDFVGELKKIGREVLQRAVDGGLGRVQEAIDEAKETVDARISKVRTKMKEKEIDGVVVEEQRVPRRRPR